MKKVTTLINNLKALVNYKKRRVYVSNPPSFIWIEPTNYCNLRCIMCPNGTDNVYIEKGFMDIDFFKEIILDIKKYASTIWLALGGESLLHQDFGEMVRFSTHNGINVCLNTNATLLNKDMSHELLYSGIKYISFAFDGFSKTMYEKARRGATFEKTLHNILYFLNLKKISQKKYPYTILSILMLEVEAYNEKEKKTFLKQFDDLIDEVRLREVSTWGSTFKDTNDFSYRENTNFAGPCSRLWSSICIAWNGDVLPCIYNMNHEYVVGNVKEKSLKEIWNSPKMIRLRKSMVENNYSDISPICDNCIILGTPSIMGIPSGIRIALADAITNFTGYWFEKRALHFANTLRKGKFSSRTIS
jgi:radical SAM protein with 4Fe4S-binding SPASM domain